MKKTITISILLLAVFLAFGCSKGEMGGGNLSLARSTAVYGFDMATSSAMPAAAPMAEMAEKRFAGAMVEEAQAMSDASDSISANLSEVERKLVKRADVRIRVENLEAADASVSGLLEKYDAYAASTIIEENSRNYSLRVPAEHYDVFLAEMNGMGRLLRRFESTEDVTLRYYDLEGRLSTKKELLKTFQAYLARARTIEEILSVEARISELQYDIEGTGMQLRNLSNRVDYATIELAILGPVLSKPRQGKTAGERVKELFGGFGGFLSTVGIVLLGIVIYGIPILLLLALLFWLFFGRVGLLKKLWRFITMKKGVGNGECAISSEQ